MANFLSMLTEAPPVGVEHGFPHSLPEPPQDVRDAHLLSLLAEAK